MCGRCSPSIARSYDLLNSVLSLGLDRYWRRRTVELMSIHPGDSVLDVACGTGMLLLEEARLVGLGGSITGADFCPPMLEIARHNIAQTPYAGMVTLVNANALALPFPPGSFDAASIGFALRNVPDIAATIAEMARVVRPGGQRGLAGDRQAHAAHPAPVVLPPLQPCRAHHRQAPLRFLRCLSLAAAVARSPAQPRSDSPHLHRCWVEGRTLCQAIRRHSHRPCGNGLTTCYLSPSNQLPVVSLG